MSAKRSHTLAVAHNNIRDENNVVHNELRDMRKPLSNYGVMGLIMSGEPMAITTYAVSFSPSLILFHPVQKFWHSPGVPDARRHQS